MRRVREVFKEEFRALAKEAIPVEVQEQIMSDIYSKDQWRD